MLASLQIRVWKSLSVGAITFGLQHFADVPAAALAVLVNTDRNQKPIPRNVSVMPLGRPGAATGVNAKFDEASRFALQGRYRLPAASVSAVTATTTRDLSSTATNRVWGTYEPCRERKAGGNGQR